MSNADASDIHSRLRQARINAGYRSAAAAADAIGVTLSTYTSHENGNRAYSSDTATCYAKGLGVSPNWLLFGEGAEHTADKIDNSQKIKRAVYGAFAAVEAMGHPVNAENISEAAARLYDLEGR
ncbi:helix-turn-helix domain-containing protein [Roseibium polysiphoniae]|uniref:Helix-turn-helix transcriptional regulator n=1 Tax=Roseibium polysiphoniae TaxID=2571221 RepID=A0ABR9CG43_9HYPH|nr:helix-turn-helix transcriptional regulator [Roseibium polysiphoniae]MBD8878623.1 helix-turn-helix transcriptional regulator [Roseibium polysiphoniae]